MGSTEALPGSVLSVHFGRSANCSSIGSYVDFLFLSAATSGVVLSTIAVLLTRRDASKKTSEPPPERDGE